MHRLIAAFLSIIFFGSSVGMLIGCTPDVPTIDDTKPPAIDGTDAKPPEDVAIIKPEHGDYQRNSLPFSDVVYVRPNINEVASKFNSVTAAITSSELPFQDQLELIRSLEEDYISVKSSYSLAQIYFYKDSSDEYRRGEYDHISTEYPKITKALEDMLVACANSAYKSEFEEEYFHFPLDSYLSGGIYTEEMVALMEREAELENEYSSLSTSTVKIRYGALYGTIDVILEKIGKVHGEHSQKYANAKSECFRIYEEKKAERTAEIFTELVKVRKLIADEAGYDSYTDLAYLELGHDYSSEDMLDFLLDLKDTVYPVFLRLYAVVFNGYFYSTKIPEASLNSGVNTLYELYNENDETLSEIYSYMLEYGLYDITSPSDRRFSGSFTTYIDSNNSPYLFVTGNGVLTDYLTLIHEFGHFADNYINFGASASLDLAEISSQALELLTLDMMRGSITPENYRMLEYYEMYSALEILMMQGFYAMFEHLVYDLDYNEITANNINGAVSEASLAIFGADIHNDLSSVLITHTMLYPHYVQSYCTSLTTSLEIFFMETNEDGCGIDIYMSLIDRNDSESLSYTEELTSAGLSSPFEDGYLKYIADMIHFRIMGSHYFRDDADAKRLRPAA